MLNSYFYEMCGDDLFCICRELEMDLERSGVPVPIFLDLATFHPCGHITAVKHGMSLRKDCKELHGVDQKIRFRLDLD